MVNFEKRSYAKTNKYFFTAWRGCEVNFNSTKREFAILAAILATSFIVRLLLFPLKGYQVDTIDFQAWFSRAATNGIIPFYTFSGVKDYPPLNAYIFWFFGSISNAAPSISVENFVKLAPNLFDIGTSILIFLFAKRQASFKIALVATAIYAFNPATIFDAAVWGQYDAIYTFFLVLSFVLALKSKPQFSAATFALGLLAKPQGIALAPLIAFLIYKKNGLKQLLISLVVFAVVVLVVSVPFQWPGGTFNMLSTVYFGAYKEYAYTSINAFNLWSLISGLWVPDGSLYIVGWVLFGAFTVFTLYCMNKFFKVSNDFLAVYAAFMLLFGFFMLPTRIHERYMFPAISVLALAFPFVKRARLLYVVLTATLLVNESYVLYYLRAAYPNFAYIPVFPVVLSVAAINLLMLLYASVAMWDKRTWLRTEPAQASKATERSEP